MAVKYCALTVNVCAAELVEAQLVKGVKVPDAVIVGTVTVNKVLTVLSQIEYVIFVVPAATPVTTPELFTVAIEVLVLDQVPPDKALDNVEVTPIFVTELVPVIEGINPGMKFEVVPVNAKLVKVPVKFTEPILEIVETVEALFPLMTPELKLKFDNKPLSAPLN